MSQKKANIDQMNGQQPGEGVDPEVKLPASQTVSGAA